MKKESLPDGLSGTAVFILIVICFVVSLHLIHKQFDKYGGPRGVIVQIGKEIKSIIEDINKEGK